MHASRSTSRLKTGNAVNVRVMVVHGWKEYRNVYISTVIWLKNVPESEPHLLKRPECIRFYSNKENKEMGWYEYSDSNNVPNIFFGFKIEV